MPTPSVSRKVCPACGKVFNSGTQCPHDNHHLLDWAEPDARVLGLVLKGAYKIEEPIGQGGMGTVYRGTQLSLGRTVAIKTMLASKQASERSVQRFLREAKLLSLINHPNIIQIIDFGFEGTGEFHYIVMEYLQGKNLDESVPAEKGLPIDDILPLMEPICAGVAAAHERQLMHRDLKPANVFLARVSGDEHVVKILDFGLARALTEGNADETVTREGDMVGSQSYASPEQIAGRAGVDARTDVYSLGGLLYFMAAGTHPFGSGDSTSVLLKQLQEGINSVDFTPLKGKPEAILIPIIRKAMATAADERYQSVPEFLAALREVTGWISSSSSSGVRSSGSRARPLTSETAVAPGSHRPSAWIAAGLVALMAAAFVIGIGYYSGPGTAGSTGKQSKPVAQAAYRGVSDNEIVLGMSAPFSGPAKELGHRMKLGIQTAFNAVNEQEGGVNGRKLTLAALDDGYEPPRALANMKTLLDERKVFCIIGNVGTPTAQAALPYVLDKQTVFFGAYTGASLLRKDPPDRYVFNYRASYIEETAAIVHYLTAVEKVPVDQIAVFQQNDGYGDAGFEGVARTVRHLNGDAKKLVRVRYERNKADVEAAVQEITKRAKDIQAVVMVATYKPAAKFILAVKEQHPKMLFANVSFVGSESLADEFRQRSSKLGQGVIVTQVVPHFESNSTGVLRFRQDLKKYFPEPDFIALEGYVVGRVFAEGLKRAGANLTNESLVSALESIKNLDMAIGTTIEFGPSQHQASHKVWGTVLDENARFQSLSLE